MREYADRMARQLAAGIPRRQLLQALAGGVLGAATASVYQGRASARGMPAAGAAISGPTVAMVSLDFMTHRPDGSHRRSRLLLYDRAMGKTGTAERRLGLVPSVQKDTGLIEVSVHDISEGSCAPKFLRRLTLPLDRKKNPDFQSVGLEDSRELALAVTQVRYVPQREGQVPSCDADCCVDCQDGDPTNCGSAVCCNIPCGPYCGACCDPGNCVPGPCSRD